MNSFIIITNYFSISNKFNSYLNKQNFQAWFVLNKYKLFALLIDFIAESLILEEIKKLIKINNRIIDIANANKKIRRNMLKILSFVNFN